MGQNILVIAGEKSGEDHAMTFFPKLKMLVPEAKFFGVAGDELQEQGVELIYHLKDFSSMGISEVLGKIPFYMKAMKRLEQEVITRKCKTAILIDFQGFNLKISKRLKDLGVNVLYYVAPQAWVWKPWRTKALEKNVHTLFTILPFEKKWFTDRGVSKTKAVAHPLIIKYGEKLHTIPERSFDKMSSNQIKEILLLPGSRNSEVSVLLPIFLDVVEKLRQNDIVIKLSLVKVTSVNSKTYEKFKQRIDQVYESHQLDVALNQSDLCLASSGTVTLATGIFELPTVVAYKMSKFNEIILKMLIPYKGPASLTNIILDEYVFPEFIQDDVTRDNLTKISLRFLTDKSYYDSTIEKLKKTKSLLSGDEFDVADYMAQVVKQ